MSAAAIRIFKGGGQEHEIQISDHTLVTSPMLFEFDGSLFLPAPVRS